MSANSKVVRFDSKRAPQGTRATLTGANTMFSKTILEEYDRELAASVLKYKINSAPDELAGWDHFFRQARGDASDFAVGLQRSLGPQERGKRSDPNKAANQARLAEWEQKREMFDRAKDYFMHMMQAAMRQARNDVANLIEQEYPGADGKWVAQEIRDVFDAADYNS